MNHDIGLVLTDGRICHEGIYVRDSMTLRQLYELVKDFQEDTEYGPFKPNIVEIVLSQFAED